MVHRKDRLSPRHPLGPQARQDHKLAMAGVLVVLLVIAVILLAVFL